MKWGAVRVLVTWLFCCNYCVVDRSTASLECPAEAGTSPEIHLRDLGGLGPMVGSAKSTRNGIIKDDLPYKFISSQAGEAYNNGTLNTQLFVNQWTSYTQNALFLGGFVLLLGILLPGVMVALWTFWECCYEEDEEEEEENRNLTLQAQLVVWGLAGVLVAMVIVLTILVGILLAGNAWISQGVERGKEIAWHTIPQLTELKDSTLHTLDSTVVGDYKDLTDQLQSNPLNQVSLNVTLKVSTTYNSPVNHLQQEVLTRLSLHPHLLSLTQTLTHLLLSTLPSLTDTLTQSLTELEQQCNFTLAMDPNTTAINDTLLALCQDFVGNLSLYLPQPVAGLGGVGADGQLLLSELEQLLRNDVFEIEPGPLPWQLFQTYLDELDTNLSLRINVTSGRHLSSLGANLSSFVVEVATFYNSSLSLNSQHRVEEYLGSRYLENWEWFRSALTVTFAVLIFLGMALLLLAVGRGLYNVTATYCYAEETAYDHGAHQAGVTMKKLTFSFLLVCIASAAFSCFFLSVAGVMGKVCGNHNNFSELVVNVVDNPSTWGGSDSPHYPLARVILEEPMFPLTVRGLLDACGTNLSLFQALHLEQRYDLEERLMLNPQDKRAYREEMRNVSVYLNRAILVSMATEKQLQYLANASAIPVLWTELSSLSPSTVYPPPFVGLPQLREMLEELSYAIEGSGSPHNLSSALNSSLSALGELEDNLLATLSTINSTALQLRSNLSVITPSLSLSLSSLAENITITAASSSNQLVSIAAQQVNRQLELFINTTITTLTCHLGSCYQLARDYEELASVTCGDVVPGMDIYWTSLMIILAVSVLIMPLSLLLASRFISLEMEKSNRKNPNFYLVGAIMRQVRGTMWFVFSLSVYLWWVVYVSRDEDLRERLCSGSQAACCDKCVWVFGIIFLLISVGVGGVSRAYQYFTIYMIKKCKVMKYQRFWIQRKKAVNFYGQLGLFVLQDLPFLVLAGTYANNVFLNVPTFYTLGVSLIGIITYITYLVRERQNIFTYWTWLKMELAKLNLAKTFNNQEPLPQVGNSVGNTTRRGPGLPNGHAHPVRSPYASSGSEHSEDSSQGTYQEHGFEFHPPRLSDIPEYPEGGLEAAAAAVGGVTRAVVEPHPHEDDGQTDTEMSEHHSQFQSRVRLDRDVDFDSDAYLQRRREAIEQFVRGGVEVAPAHYRRRDLETSTISDSYYYGSRDSIELQEYCSSSQAPDTNSYYESSDYREEDCESEYSQAKYRLPLGGFMGEVTVDV